MFTAGVDAHSHFPTTLFGWLIYVYLIPVYLLLVVTTSMHHNSTSRAMGWAVGVLSASVVVVGGPIFVFGLWDLFNQGRLFTDANTTLALLYLLPVAWGPCLFALARRRIRGGSHSQVPNVSEGTLSDPGEGA